MKLLCSESGLLKIWLNSRLSSLLAAGKAGVEAVIFVLTQATRRAQSGSRGVARPVRWPELPESAPGRQTRKLGSHDTSRDL